MPRSSSSSFSSSSAAASATAALLAASLAAVARAQCFDASACTIVMPDPQDPTRSWMYNMQPLCNSGSGYAFTNGSTLYRFEICGNVAPLVPNLPPFVGDGVTQGQVIGSAQTNTYCNPEYSAYPNVGSFIQFFGPNPATTCYYGPTSGTPASAFPGGTPYGGCPFVGNVGAKNLPQLCCTDYCEVAGFGAPGHMQAMDVTNTSVGVTWMSMGGSSNMGDEFSCPIDPNTGYPRQRRVLHEMFCDPTGRATDPLVVNSVFEPESCTYAVSMTHKLGCGAPTPCKLDGF